jgi:hypothetical protein
VDVENVENVAIRRRAPRQGRRVDLMRWFRGQVVDCVARAAVR